jgi:hypothetical protein
MEHPLIGNLDSLTTDQLREKVYELTRKMNTAIRMNNQPMVTQIQMALESYNVKYQERMKADSSASDYDDIIDIK